jgi:hypothetical protein
MVPLEILVLAPSPTHPQDYGNRKRINEVCRSLKGRGARIHYVYYPAEADWREAMPLEAYRAMTQAWDSFHVVPTTRPLHAPSAGEDHTIDEWWDAAIGQFLTWLFSVKRFDVFVVNYTWLSKAFEFAPQGVFKILDTHDRFSGRRELLAAHGIAKEFFHTTAAEEAIALNRADLVWAIKDEERDFFRTLTDRPVLTLLHADPEQRVERTAMPGDEGYLVVGCIGARNNVNCTNIRNFLAAALPIFTRYMAPIKVRLAGGMCQDLPEFRRFPGVELVGRLENADDFYAMVDVALIPMNFSTGLKIKTAEGLAAGAALMSHAHAFEGFPASHPYHQLESFEQMAEACVELAFERAALEKLRGASAAAQASLRRLTEAALDETFDRVRRSSPRIVLALPEEVMLESGTVAAHIGHTRSYLRYLSRLVFYCDFDVTPAGARLLKERFAHVGPIIIAPGRRCPEGLAHARATLRELEKSQSMLALWLFALPREMSAPGGLPLRIPVYVRTDVLDQIAVRPTPEALRDALRPCRDVKLLGADEARLATLAASVEHATTIRVPYLTSKRLRVLQRWDDRPRGERTKRVMILTCSSQADLARIVVKVVESRTAGAADVTIIYCNTKPAGIDGRTGGAPVTWLSLEDVNRDLTNLGARPDLVVVLNPDEYGFAHIIEFARRQQVPVIVPRGTEVVRAFRSFSPAGFLINVANGLSDDNLPKADSHEEHTRVWRYMNDSGWAHLWRTLTERRKMARMVFASTAL